MFLVERLYSMKQINPIQLAWEGIFSCWQHRPTCFIHFQ